VYDRARRPPAAGAGLQLAPNATRLLARLGVPRHLPRGRAVGASGLDLRHGVDGRVLGRVELGPACVAHYGAPHVTVLRADLAAALLATVGPHRVRLDRPVARVVEHGAGAGLVLADGSCVEADVVVGADGIRSAVRRHLGGGVPVASPHDMLRGLAPAPAGPPRVTVWVGRGRHCVTYPVAGRALVSVAASVPAAGERAWSAPATTAEALDAYAGWHPELRALLAAVAPLRRWALHEAPPLERWCTGRVALVGDAAHAMLPFLAQGANQAVEDAVALATVLDGAVAADVPHRLARYAALRRPRTAAVVAASRANAARPSSSPGAGSACSRAAFARDAATTAAVRGRRSAA
jgi:salicylate hydroxylase